MHSFLHKHSFIDPSIHSLIDSLIHPLWISLELTRFDVNLLGHSAVEVDA